MKRVAGFFFYILWFFVYNIITYSSAFVVLVGSIFLTARHGRFLRRLVSIWSRTGIILALSPIEIRGKENLIDDPCLLLCNHQSTLDILVCSGYFPQDFLFFSKKEVYYLPLIGSLMKKMNYISVDRKNPKSAARSIIQAIQKIKDNNRVLIFPEGSRNSHPKELMPFKPGSMLIARQGKVPIVPMIIYGTREVLPHDHWYMMPGKIVLQIMEPIFADNKMHPSSAASVAEEDAILENLRLKLSDQYNKIAEEIEGKKG